MPCVCPAVCAMFSVIRLPLASLGACLVAYVFLTSCAMAQSSHCQALPSLNDAVTEPTIQRLPQLNTVVVKDARIHIPVAVQVTPRLSKDATPATKGFTLWRLTLPNTQWGPKHPSNESLGKALQYAKPGMVAFKQLTPHDSQLVLELPTGQSPHLEAEGKTVVLYVPAAGAMASPPAAVNAQQISQLKTQLAEAQYQLALAQQLPLGTEVVPKQDYETLKHALAQAQQEIATLKKQQALPKQTSAVPHVAQPAVLLAKPAVVVPKPQPEMALPNPAPLITAANNKPVKKTQAPTVTPSNSSKPKTPKAATATTTQATPVLAFKQDPRWPASLAEADPNKAELLLKALIKAYPHNLEPVAALANRQQQAGNWPLAIKTLQQFLAQHPDHAATYEAMGMIYLKEARWHDARLAFERVPNPTAVLQYGLQCRQRQQWPAAEQALTLATQLTPQDATPYFYLGTVQAATQKLTEAEAHFKQANQLSSNRPEVLYNLGVVLARQHRNPEAAQYLQQYLTTHPIASNRAAVEATLQQLASPNNTSTPQNEVP
jgi:tetratricopeptide (TPR) repeat protein